MARNDQEFSNRILIVEVSGPGKTNSLLHRRNHQSDIDKIYLYAKDPYEAKYQLLFNKRERNDTNAFIEYSNDTYWKVLENTILIIKLKMLIVLDMITDMYSNENLNPIVTKLFIRGRKLNIYLVFITQSFFFSKRY